MFPTTVSVNPSPQQTKTESKGNADVVVMPIESLTQKAILPHDTVTPGSICPQVESEREKEEPGGQFCA